MSARARSSSNRNDTAVRSDSVSRGGICAGSPLNVNGSRPIDRSRSQRNRLSSMPARLSAIDARTSAVDLSATATWIGLGSALLALRCSAIALFSSRPSRRITSRRVSADWGSSKTVACHGPRLCAVTRCRAIPWTPSAAASDLAITTLTVPAWPAWSVRRCPVSRATPSRVAFTLASTDAGALPSSFVPSTRPTTWGRTSPGIPSSTSRSAGSFDVRSSLRQ